MDECVELVLLLIDCLLERDFLGILSVVCKVICLFGFLDEMFEFWMIILGVSFCSILIWFDYLFVKEMYVIIGDEG